MKNLKKVLCLVLAFTMLMSMMVMTTGAANFTDNDEIENTEAVDTMVSLNIINGKGDGSYFDPTGIVTRAEMAKMICVALNGGKDPQLGNTSSSYTDTVGHWAAGYIEYCTNLGIVSGRGNGIFDPNATVTGTEASKMLLVALGYSSDEESFTGSSWAINVNIRANQKDLYDELESMNPSLGLTRDNAAQMVYNAINAQMVEYEYKVTTVNGQITTVATLKDKTTSVSGTDTKVTILSDKYGMNTDELTLNGNYDSGDAAKKDQIDVGGRDITYTLNNGLEWIGETVTVLWKESGDTVGLDSKDKIYGVYNDGQTTVYKTTKSALQDNKTAGKLRWGDTDYSVAAASNGDTYIDYNYGASAVTLGADKTASEMEALFRGALKVSNNGDTIKFVCNDDGKIVKAYVVESVLSYVTSVNNDKVSISGVGAITFDDNDIYDGVAKNDVVVYTKLYNLSASDATFIVTKADSVSGEVKGYKANTGSSTDKITLDGTAYKVYNKAAMLSTVGEDSGSTYLTNDDIGDTFTLYLVNGMVAAAVQDSEDAVEYAIVTDINGGKLDSSMSSAKAELLLADGTSVAAVLHKDSLIYTNTANGYDNSTTAMTTSDTLSNTFLSKGQLVKYTVTSDGSYKITEVGSYSTASGTTQVYEKDTKTFGSSVTSGTCPLFALVGSDYKVYDVRSLGDVSVAGSTDYGYYTKDGKVVAAYVELASRPSSSSSDMVYGIVTGGNGVVEIDSDYYNSYTVKNETDSYTVYMDGSTLSTGALVGFDKASDDIYVASDVTVYTGTTFDATNGLAVRVKSYSESDQTLTYYTTVSGSAGAYVGGSPTTVALDDDCIIAYVDADDDAAGENVGINAFDGITGYKNALLVKDSSTSKVVAILVESSGDANILNSTSVTLGALSAAFSASTDQVITVDATSNDTDIASATFAWKTTSSFATAGSAPADLSVSFDATNQRVVFTEGTNASVAANSYYVTITFTTISGETYTYDYTLVVAA